MLKLTLYLFLTLIGVAAAFRSPFTGAIAVVDSYLFNPSALLMPHNDLNWQLIIAVPFLIGLAMHRQPALPRAGSERWPLMALWVFFFIAVIASGFSEFSREVAYVRLYEVFKTLLITTLLLWCFRSESQLRTFMNWMILGVLHAAALHVIGPKLGYIGAGFGREYGVLPDAQRAVMVCFVPLLLLVAVSGTRNERILAFVTLAFALDSIVNTYERTGFVAVLVEFALVMLFSGRLTIKLAPALIVVVLVMLLRFTPANYWEWIGTIRTPEEEASAASRFELNKASIRMFKDHPILGVGYRNYPYMARFYMDARLLTSSGLRAAHNGFLTILTETGIFGFIAWTAGFFGAAFSLRRLRKARDSTGYGIGGSMIPIYALGLELGLYGWIVNNLTQADHEVDPAFWFVGLAIVMTRLYAIRIREAARTAGDPATAASRLPGPKFARPGAAAALPAPAEASLTRAARRP